MKEGGNFSEEKLSLGFRFRYGFRENVRIHNLRHGFTFANLEEQIRITVSPSEIWGRNREELRLQIKIHMIKFY